MGENAVRTTVSNVKVTAEGSEWAGRDAVKSHVTPLKVEIRNESDQPVRIRYQDFALESKEGDRFAALSLFEIEGTVRKPKAVSFARTPYQTRFYHRGFFTAPYYTNIYPGLRPYPYTYEYSASDYSKSYDYWKEIELPTKGMQESALPEGALEPGGQVRGHLFFEKVPADVESVSLNFKLINAGTGKTIGSGKLPLRVTE